jgi:hypothetical protein
MRPTACTVRGNGASLLTERRASRVVVVGRVRSQQMAKMPLAEHDNVVKTFPADRTDRPFTIPVLPRRSRRVWPIPNAHHPKAADENFTIRAIPIADQIAGKLLPSAGFRYLVCDPFRGRMRRYSEPYDLSSAMPHDQQTIEQTERDCRHDEQIDRGNAVGMIAEERLPPLGRTSPLRHIFSYARLSDRDVELEQLSMDPWRSPTGGWRCSSPGPVCVFPAELSADHHEVATSSASTHGSRHGAI